MTRQRIFQALNEVSSDGGSVLIKAHRKGGFKAVVNTPQHGSFIGIAWSSEDALIVALTRAGYSDA
jgi:hypothetical protein